MLELLSISRKEDQSGIKEEKEFQVLICGNDSDLFVLIKCIFSKILYFVFSSFCEFKLIWIIF